MRRAVDFSQYGGELAQATIACWETQNVGRAVVQYNTTGHMEQHLQTLVQAGGLGVQVYVAIPGRMQDAIIRSAGRASFFWIDVETNAFVNAAQVRDAIAACRAADVPFGIYTSRSMWSSLMGNTAEFSWVPLWDARYVGTSPTPLFDLEPTSLAFIAYGGWTACVMRQWQGTTTFCGHSVDMNIYEPPPVEDEDMGLPYTARWIGESYYVVVARGTDNQLYSRSWSRAANAYTDWVALPGGAVSDEPSMTANDSQVHVVAKMQDGSLGHWFFASGQWRGFEPLGGRIGASFS